LARDEVRLLVSRIANDNVVHTRFAHMGEFLRPGDVLVINTSATINAALDARTANGTMLELHLSTRLSADDWVIELRSRGVRGTAPFLDGEAGQVLSLPRGASVALAAPYSLGPRPRLWRAVLRLPGPTGRYLETHGYPIRYGYVDEQWPIAAYQTAYGTEAGSAEMPSAGRPFTPGLITRLIARGVDIVPTLLHTGVSSLEEGEAPYPEYYRVEEPSARRITRAREDGRRIIAVGTTVVRTLETVTDDLGVTGGGAGWTGVVVTPATGARSVDGLLTGLHEPRASHLSMLAAIAGCGHLRIAYAAALRERYLWHEFGDLHLILPE
jgi:S-adenosylmethionine:tRNA ribosyltransferase-isomerase